MEDSPGTFAPRALRMVIERPRVPIAGAFALACILFFTPFLSVDCGGHTVATIAGTSLVTGTDIGGDTARQHIGPAGSAIVALLAVAIALVLTVAGAWWRSLAQVGLGLAAFAGLLWLRADGDAEAAKYPAVQIWWLAGYWLTVLATLVGAGLGSVDVLRNGSLPRLVTTVAQRLESPQRETRD